MRRWRPITWASLALAALVGCSQELAKAPHSTAAVNLPDPVYPWFLKWTDLTNKTPAYLSDGRSGVRFARDGTRLLDGERLSSNSNDEEHVSEIEWFVDDVRLDPTAGTHYSQSLNLRHGVLRTQWEQQVGAKRIKIICLTWSGRESDSLWNFTSDTDAVLSSDGPGVDGLSTELEAGVGKLVGDPVVVASVEAEYGEVFEFGFLAPLGLDPIEISTDIEVDGSVVDDQAIRSMLFYLRQSMGADVPPGPMGLSNDTYKGHIFWDSDMWMFPALALTDPEKSRQIGQFRIDKLAEAKWHANWTLVGHKQTDWRPHVPARFPWESGIDGRDKTEGSTVKGDHQSGGVAWSLDMASALGLVDEDDAMHVGTAVANYYKRRLKNNVDGQAEIRDVTGVDEWFEGDNCLYTNAIADWTIKTYLGEDVNMYYPRDEKGLLAYDGDERLAYKQAAAPLILWPLEREDLVDDPIAFLDLFEGKESPNGPAMSLSVYALIRARYGDADQAYETWRESWKRYTDGNPLMLFSEKPGRPDLTYFLTGAAGCLNAVIYGFIGVRILGEEPEDEAKLKLMNGKWLVVRPNLPKAWKSVTFRGMQVLGKSYDVRCEGRTASITPTD